MCTVLRITKYDSYLPYVMLPPHKYSKNMYRNSYYYIDAFDNVPLDSSPVSVWQVAMVQKNPRSYHYIDVFQITPYYNASPTFPVLDICRKKTDFVALQWLSRRYGSCPYPTVYDGFFSCLQRSSAVSVIHSDTLKT